MGPLQAVDAGLEWVVPDALRRDADVFRQAKRVAAFDLAFLFWITLFGGVYVALGSPWCGLVTWWTALPILASLLAIKLGRSPVWGGNLLCLAGYVTLTSLGLFTGGWTAIPPMTWYTVLPVVAVLTCGVVWGVVWTLIPLATIGLFAMAEAYGIAFPQELRPGNLAIFGYAVVAGLLVCQFVLAWVRVGIEQRALVALREAKRDLAKARATAAMVKEGFGITVEDWRRLQREKAALEYVVNRRFGTLEVDDEAGEWDDGDLDDSDLEDSDLDSEVADSDLFDGAKTTDG